MSIEQVNGAHYELPQKIVVDVVGDGVLADDVDQANVSGEIESVPTVTLPAKPRPGQVVTIAAVGTAVTVAPNAGQTLPGVGATTVSADFQRNYVCVTTVLWAAQAQ